MWEIPSNPDKFSPCVAESNTVPVRLCLEIEHEHPVSLDMIQMTPRTAKIISYYRSAVISALPLHRKQRILIGPVRAHKLSFWLVIRISLIVTRIVTRISLHSHQNISTQSSEYISTVIRISLHSHQNISQES